MSEIPDNVLNPKLYQKAKDTVYPRYKRASAYRSMALVKEYIKLGGKYKNDGKTSKLDRWRKEEWVSVIHFLNGKVVKCGDDDIGNNACRPSKRIDSNTPTTIQELVKKFGIERMLKLAEVKIKNMNNTVNWNSAKIIGFKWDGKKYK